MQKKNMLVSIIVALVVVVGIAYYMNGQKGPGGVKIGSLSAITGPIVSLVEQINAAERAAIEEINAAGGVLGGDVALVEADTACAEATAIDAANKLINVEQVSAIVGALCSGASMGAHSVALDAGVVMLSPASTSPAITSLDDNDLFFRNVPSDAYQGEVLAQLVMDQGIDSISLTYINNDYGVGFANAFRDAYTALNGNIYGDQAHEEGKASYASELASLASSNTDTLIILAYGDGSGLTMIRESLEAGHFARFAGGDGMKSDALLTEIGADNLAGNFFGTIPGSTESDSNKTFSSMYGDGSKFVFDSPYVGTAYDAVFTIALAIQKAGVDALADRSLISTALRDVATAPGTVVGPGDWEKAVGLIAKGEDIDYEGATGSASFDANGDVPRVYNAFTVSGSGYAENAI